jgi:hypothetical protein
MIWEDCKWVAGNVKLLSAAAELVILLLISIPK